MATVVFFDILNCSYCQYRPSHCQLVFDLVGRASMIDFRYRPDVDGLRAVAVILVLLFHADLGFSGGFIGVDVFFVLSGFLITGLILKEQEAEKFKLANFWIRRIRRIIPAATVLVIAVLVAGFFVLLPGDYADLGKSAIAQQLMLSNVYFWQNTGYFDGPAELKPLLHTWSLAVEEQFYLGYPFLLVLLHLLGRRAMVTMLAALAIVSLVVSQYGVIHYPSATFFLLPTRAWELLIGGLIWFIPKQRLSKPWLSSSVSWLSLAAILVAGWFYNSTTPFPGLTALVPCIATAAFVYFNSNRLSFPAAALATKPVVFVGLISYSLYLWHWPILVFLRYLQDGEPSLPMRLGALLASLSLAYLSWRFVETPFRKLTLLRSGRSVAFFAALCSLGVVLIGTAIYRSDGVPYRYPREVVAILSTMRERGPRHDVPENDVTANKLPHFGALSENPKILIWGDSHAMCMAPALDAICLKRHIGGVFATHNGTLPLIGFSNSRDWSAPRSFNDSVLKYIIKKDIRIVVLAGYWSRDADRKEFSQCYRDTIEQLLKAGCFVVVVQDNPQQKLTPTKAIARYMKLERDLSELGISLEDHRQCQAAANVILNSLKHENLCVINPAPFLTDDNGRCRIVMGDVSLYYDNNHLSVAGANRLIPMFEQVLEQYEESLRVQSNPQ